MVQASKTFRIFVSSTFSDLKAERNALQERVFPRLRELCMAHGFRFQAIDLRWGVSEEASIDQRTMRICLEEIARCRRITPRPNFIILLGDRYGWRPLPEEIPAREFEEIEKHMKNTPEHSLLAAWYKRDDNAVPAVYCLRSRRDEFEDYEVWENRVERPLREALRSVVAGTGLTEDAGLKYEASATEQEIAAGALWIPNADEHVFAFMRTIPNLPDDKRAKDFIDLDAEGNVDAEAQARLQRLKQKLADYLRTENICHYEARWTGDGITADHIGSVRRGDEEGSEDNQNERGASKLCQDVYDRLAAAIEEQMERFESLEALEQQIQQHDDFGEERARFFTGRAAPLKIIADYCNSSDCHPLVIHGEPGSGKSALMARAVELARRAHPNAHVIVRYIGATPDSSNGRALLESLCRQLSDCYGADASDIPLEYKDLVVEFPKRLALATAEMPLIVFLDALDQLSDADNARLLPWLPRELPKHVHLVVSTLPGECLQALEATLPDPNRVELSPMPPAEGEALLDRWLAYAGRALQPDQRAEVLNKFKRCGLPLYLKLAFEEARRWCSYDPVPDLGGDIPGIIHNLFDRLSHPANHGQLLVSRALGYLRCARNGLTEDELLDLLARDEEYFSHFLEHAQHDLLEKGAAERRVPVVIWSRLYHDIEPYLTERSADHTLLLAFYHRQLGDTVDRKFLTPEQTRCARHASLAKYFSIMPNRVGEQVLNFRRLAELPWQQTSGKVWKDLENTLTDLRFVEAKCMAGMTHDLIDDYQRALEPVEESSSPFSSARLDRIGEYINRLAHYSSLWTLASKRHKQDPIRHALPDLDDLPFPEIPASICAHPNRPSREKWHSVRASQSPANKHSSSTYSRTERIAAFAAFVNREAHHILESGHIPCFCLQQAFNFQGDGPVHDAVTSMNDPFGCKNTVILRRHFRPEAKYARSPLIRTVTDSQDSESRHVSVSLSADGKILLTASGMILRVWDTVTGACTNTLRIRSDSDRWAKERCTCLDVTGDGRRALVGTGKGRLLLFDLRSLSCRQIFHNLGECIYSVAISPDARTGVSAGSDKRVGRCRLDIWDLETAECLHTEKDTHYNLTEVALPAYGFEIVVGRKKIRNHGGYWGCPCRLLSVQNGRYVSHFESDVRAVNDVAVTPDGRIALTAGDDNLVRVWDIATGRILRRLQGHSESVAAVAITHDGRLGISGGFDNYICIWDIETAQLLNTFEEHESSVCSIDMAVDGRLAASAGSDGTVLLWDLTLAEHGHRKPSRPGGLVLHRIAGDGKHAATVYGNLTKTWTSNVFAVWDTETGKIVRSRKAHKKGTNAIEFTPGSNNLVTAGHDGALLLWSWPTGRCFRSIRAARDSIGDMKLTPDGRFALISIGKGSGLPGDSVKTQVALWDLESRQRVWFAEREFPICALAVAPDGVLAISCQGLLYHEAILTAWNMKTGQCLWEQKTPMIFDTARRFVAISATGREIPYRCNDRSTRVVGISSSGESCRKWHHDAPGFMMPNGQTMFFIKGKSIELRDWQRLNLVAKLGLPRRILSLDVKGNILGVCYESGAVDFFAIKNLPVFPMITTLVRFWDFGGPGLFPLFSFPRPRGTWVENLSALCFWCGRRFEADARIVDTVTAVNREARLSAEQSPCLELPQEAWDEPGLLSECPHCGGKLKFNPFIVDNKERC